MSLSPFTNEYGQYSRREFRENKTLSWGYDWWTPGPPHTDYSGDVIVVEKVTKTHTSGDHKTPLYYRRFIDKVTHDKPFITEQKEFYDNGIPRSYKLRTWWSSLGVPLLQTPDTLRYTGLFDEANTKALNALGDVKSQVLANLAQARQTVNAFVDVTTRSAQFLLALKRGQLALAAQQLGVNIVKDRGMTASTLWLQYSYGWKPLAADLYGLSQVAGEALAKECLIKGYAKAVGSSKETYNNGQFKVNEVTSRSVKTTLVGTLDNARNRQLNQIGLSNPASLAWELVPWSFAIDWFIPVGNYLEAITATYGLNFKKGWTSYIDQLEKSWQLDPSYFQGNTAIIDPGYTREEYYHFHRNAFNDWPRAGIYANQRPYSTTRALNALALVRQLLR